MKKLNLNPEDILNFEPKVDFKGYSAAEVDEFLDSVLEDYQTMEDNVQDLLNLISKLQEQVKTLTAKNVELEGKKKVFDLANTTQYSSVDVLKRLSRVEEQVYNK